MTPKETALILRLHNAWRRGYESSPNMTEPKLLGEVIDSAISLIEQHDELLAAKTNLRQQVAHMTDQLAGEKSNVELANQQCDELLVALEGIAQFANSSQGQMALRAIASVKGGA